MAFKPGDWVELKPEADVPAICRPDGKPTRGRVEEVCGRRVEVWIPIGGADVDEHSQCVFYDAHVLRAASS
jgi:hypothetical protein